ncbi:hypothetical protein BJY52DRAFT_1202336 [Lactarius psammicola]|nr:hypothetical protein BJY52DRAFT_1202336 [Lactarius psammicola]
MASTATRSWTLITRHASRTTQNRLLSSSAVLREEAPAHVGVAPSPKKPVGGIRGGVIGFLFGFSLASSFAAYRLLDEYKQASATLQASVEELQQSTEKVSAHVRRIEADDLSRLRAEIKKIYAGLHIEFLDLRTFVWGMQQDVHAITKKDAKDAKQLPAERI